MALERMHDVLYARLEVEGASQAEKNVWQALWNESQAHPGKPLPCPVCFAATGATSRVKALPNTDGIARAKCEECHSQFEWPDADG